MAFEQGVKFLKINKVDALGSDKTTILNQLKNIKIVRASKAPHGIKPDILVEIVDNQNQKIHS